jgi:hypothetical protein
MAWASSGFMSIESSGGAAMTEPREFNTKRLRLIAMLFSEKTNAGPSTPLKYASLRMTALRF